MIDKLNKIYDDVLIRRRFEFLVSEIKRIKLELDILKTNIDNINEYTKQLQNKEIELNRNNAFFNKIFNNKKHNEAKKELEYEIKSLKIRIDAIEPKDTLITRIEEVSILLKKYEQEKSSISIDNLDENVKNFIIDENGFLQVTSTSNANYYDENKLEDFEKYITHSTSKFPYNHVIKSGYDGEKIDLEGTKGENQKVAYFGVKKGVPNFSQRRSVHFMMNSIVGDNGYGVWDNNDYLIIEPYDIHKEEFINSGASDAWTRSSVNLSKEAILFINKSVVNKVPKEKLKEYNVITYDGDNKNKSQFLNTLFNSLNIKKINTSINDPAHQGSVDYVAESSLKKRNAVISLILNKQVLPKDKINLSTDELIKVIQIYMKQDVFYNLKNRICFNENNKQEDINYDFLIAYILCGFNKNNDNFESLEYEDIIKLIEYINSMSKEEFKNYLNKNDIYYLSKIFKENDFNNNKENSVILKEIENLSYEDINCLENVKKEEILSNYIKELITKNIKGVKYLGDIVFCNDAIVIDFLVENGEFEYCISNKNFKFYPIKFLNIEYNKEAIVSFLLNCKEMSIKEIINQINEYIKMVNYNMELYFTIEGENNIKL